MNQRLPNGSETGDAKRLSLQVLNAVFAGQATKAAGFRLWDGTRWPDDGPRLATVVLNHPGALRSMLVPGHELGLAEAYLFDDFDVEGEMEPVFNLADPVAEATAGWRKKLHVAKDLLRLPAVPHPHTDGRGAAHLSGKPHSIERDRQAVTYHYNVSNDFYRLWLDRRMVYSCAYFTSPEQDLDTAQEQKLDHICRKLRLQPGQRLLDIGCGWGGLVMHAASCYGVDATGITLSEPQAALANERIEEAGLAGRARVLVQDYREVEGNEDYDRLVSVGMFEHVGEKLLPSYFSQAQRLLRPGGAFLNHGIAISAAHKPGRGPNFNDAYVFPDGELVPINTTLRAAEGAGFEVRDVESLREHYSLTLRHWVHRLEAQRAAAVAEVGEVTYRVWRLFMSGSAHGFNHGRLSVFQTLLVKPDGDGRSGVPLTRDDWYA